MRDPERIPMILAALERQWRKEPDSRLGQVFVNFLLMNRNVPSEEEGMVLFNIEDGELLRWIGPETDEERQYIEQQPRKAREGWQDWERAMRERRNTSGEDG